MVVRLSNFMDFVGHHTRFLTWCIVVHTRGANTQDLMEAETILTTQLSEAPIFTTSSTSEPSLASRNLALAPHHVKTKGTNAVGAGS